jgi:membrane-associated phospholipid phosphatase
VISSKDQGSIVLEIASWINPEEAGTFFGQHAILVFSLVLAGILATSISLSCLLYQLTCSRICYLAPADGRQFQPSAISSKFRDRLLYPFVQVVYRLSTDGHRRLFFAISLFVLTVTGVSFLLLALEVGRQDWIIRFDYSLCTSLHEHSTANAVWIFQLASSFGDASTLASISLFSLIVLVVIGYWRLFFLWIISLTGAGILNQFLKYIFHRHRPQLPNPWIPESGWSFPSGHAMCSLVIYGLSTYTICFLTTSRTLRLSFGLITIGLVTAIGFSRLYLGAHYFSDVMAGYLAATFWLVACMTGNRATSCLNTAGKSENRPDRTLKRALSIRQARKTDTNGATASR